MKLAKAPPIFPVPERLKFDETGHRYGKLRVLGFAGYDGRRAKWACACDCGGFTRSLGGVLRSGGAQSCGCVAAEKSRIRQANLTPEQRRVLSAASVNATHRMSKHPIYTAWADMKQRCENPRNAYFYCYGGRGIQVCKRWHKFENFAADLLEGWRPGLSLDRIDYDGNYTPENCRWATALQQMNNRACNVRIDTPKGSLTVSQAARAFHISRDCLSYRVRAGWPIEKALTKKSQRA